ncbi:hypothetical protein ACK0BT_26720, partial [Klebsiella pneumoniae]|uniref:hypothetical protein n=1 Tax=Escherichia coli TaxID=562 RepID=UPI001BC84544
EWVHVQLHQQKGMISLSPPTICNSAIFYNATPIIDCVSSGLNSGYLSQGLLHVVLCPTGYFVHQ